MSKAARLIVRYNETVLEARVLSALIKYLERKRFYYVRITQASRAGVPDVVACILGKFYALECKGSRGKSSKLQELNERRVSASFGEYSVIDPVTLEEFKRAHEGNFHPPVTLPTKRRKKR